MNTNVDKEVLLDAFDDICTIFDFEKEIDVKKASAEEIIDFLEKKQSTDDKFHPEDLDTLQPDTVELLKKIGITLPSSKTAKKETKKPATKKEVKEEKEVKKEAKKPVVKKETKETAKKETTGEKSIRQQRHDIYRKLFAKGVTKKQAIEAILEKFPDRNPKYIQIEICEFKNPKYNRLEKLVVETDDGILKFED